MDYFNFRAGEAYAEHVPLKKLAAHFGTPLFVYSKTTLVRHCRKLVEAFAAYPTSACFAVKANSNLAFLKEIFNQGLGADIVSLGELKRSLLAGVDAENIVFSGVGKKDEEIHAGLDAGILSFNVESEFELENIARIAASSNQQAPISLRINPNIDAGTDPKITTGLHTTKFGISEDQASRLVRRIRESSHLNLVGLACHIGSQITELGPLRAASRRMAALSREILAEGFQLKLLNMGGGLGIRYGREQPPKLDEYASTLIENVKDVGLRLVIEPGRVIAGNSGVLLTEVIGVKSTPAKNFVVVDAAMTELVRPAFYGAYHEILTVDQKENDATLYDVVGPVCESSDVLGIERRFVEPKKGDLMFIRGCGGYAAAMASNYNSRPRPAEVMIDGDKVTLIRKRESLDDLWRLENL